MTTARKIKKIVPVDFSERGVGAHAIAEAFVGRLEAKLTLLHLVDAASDASAAGELHRARQVQFSGGSQVLLHEKAVV